METQAQLKQLRMSPRKVRLLVDMVRGMKAVDAVVQLTYSKKSAAKPVKKLIESAMANAEHNHKIEKSTLVVKRAFVNEGDALKRWMPRAMGRATPLRKRASHITVILEGDTEEIAVQEAVVQEEATNVTPKSKKTTPVRAAKKKITQ
ncbi:MAG: 50S ribosomal protein L22 [Candidatus Magasanikbacteria bacterium]|nr:50S ribosomal protein L22 [Candidatus Magasanikbacteria bacterium]